MFRNDAARSRATDTRWFAVWALFLCGCTLALHIGKMPSALLPLRVELGLSLTEAGAVVSTYAILIALSGIALGLLVTLAGHVRFAVLGVALAGVGSLLGATAEALPLLLLSRALEGTGWIVAVVAIPSVLAPLASDGDRPLVMGLWGAFVPVGAGVMLLVAPGLQSIGGWRLSWVVAGLVSLAASAVVASVCRHERGRLGALGGTVGSGDARRAASLVPRRVGEPSDAPRIATASASADLPDVAPPSALALASGDLRRPLAWLVGLCFFCYSFQFIAVTSFLPTLLVETAGFALGPASALAALVILGNAAGNVGAGLLLRRGVGHVPLLAGAALFAGAAAALAYHAGWPLPLRLGAAFAFSIVGGVIPGTLFATVPRLASAPATVGALIGLMLQCSGLGQWLGPLALPAVVEGFGSWSAAGLPTLAAGALGTVAALALRRL